MTQNNLPFIIHNESASDVFSYYQANQAAIATQLAQSGAVLFRDFRLGNVQEFNQLVSETLSEFVEYVGSATPRKALAQNVATSTEYPSEQEIRLHNELSYEHRRPDKLFFACLTAPETGGQTTLANVNQVYHAIAPEIIDQFKARDGWMLVRNYGQGFGPTIEAGFGTNDHAQIKQTCNAREVKVEFLASGAIRTTQILDAVHNHPTSGLPLWMNHVAFWHSSSLSAELLAVLSQLFKPHEFPYATFFADGTIIPDSYIDNILQAYKSAEITFDWREGDVLLLDNYLVAHGRKPFTGDRLVVVSMGN